MIESHQRNLPREANYEHSLIVANLVIQVIDRADLSVEIGINADTRAALAHMIALEAPTPPKPRRQWHATCQHLANEWQMKSRYV
jgi:hypothetical protein